MTMTMCISVMLEEDFKQVFHTIELHNVPHTKFHVIIQTDFPCTSPKSKFGLFQVVDEM